MSCAKTAEPIDLRFGLWTRVGRRKYKFSRVCQVAPMCRHWRHVGAIWRIQLYHPSVAVMQPYVKLHWPFLLSPCVADVDIIFLPCGFYLYGRPMG